MSFQELKEEINNEKKIIEEIFSTRNQIKTIKDKGGKKALEENLNSLENKLKEVDDLIVTNIKKLSLNKPLVKPLTDKEKEIAKGKAKENEERDSLEKRTLKRFSKEDKKNLRKITKKPSRYLRFASKVFSKTSKSLVEKGLFKTLERDLVKANMQFVPAAYVSITFYTTMLSLIASFILFAILLFIKISPATIGISLIDIPLSQRFLEIFWILFVIPIGTFLFTYYYPSLEKKAAETKINQELPFATINMAAISGSMINPTKIFTIMVQTKEYPALEKQFNKLMNEINIYGYDLVTALKSVAYNSPSKKLSDLFNGLATTISSGGNLPEFFDKRSESLLFEHKIEREKNTKAAETFMDIYISVVIAAPMILMLLLMMIKMGGLGISISTGAITLITIMAVAVINVIFLAFLQVRSTE